jgi:hypothetical protein
VFKQNEMKRTKIKGEKGEGERFNRSEPTGAVKLNEMKYKH